MQGTSVPQLGIAVLKLDNPKLTKSDNANILYNVINWRGPIGCDVETVSLDDRTPLGAAFAIDHKTAVYFHIQSPMFPWQLLENPSNHVVFHNYQFDVEILNRYNPNGKQVTSYLDSCIAGQLLGLPARLSELSEILFSKPQRPISDLIGKGKDAIGMDKVPFDKVAERGCLDAIDCLEAWNAIAPHIPEKAWNLEARFMPMALDMKYRGIQIDRQRVHEHRVRFEREMQVLRSVCFDMGFNPGSTLQLGQVMESKGITVPVKRQTGKYILDKNTIKMFYMEIQEAQLALRYRSLQTKLTHLIKPLDEGKYLKGDMIYPNVNLNITDTGRISRSGPATQNVTDEIKDIVVPHSSGDSNNPNVIWDWDHSQIELRWIAFLFNVKRMKEYFDKGIDVHDGTAQDIIDLGYGKALGTTADTIRKNAKIVNFTMAYNLPPDLTTTGVDAASAMWKNNQIPKEAGRILTKAYFQAYPEIYEGIKWLMDFANQNGFTYTWYGRQRRDARLGDRNPYVREAALRALINHPIQGSAAETMKETLWHTRGNNYFHTVHDEGLFSAPRNTTPNLQLDGHAPFTTPAKVKLGNNWKDMVEIKV